MGENRGMRARETGQLAGLFVFFFPQCRVGHTGIQKACKALMCSPYHYHSSNLNPASVVGQTSGFILHFYGMMPCASLPHTCKPAELKGDEWGTLAMEQRCPQ